MEIKEIPIEKIIVKDRFRVDKGDIEELAQGIQEKGLIHPITVSDRMELVSGERRLLAHKHLGRATIPAIIRDSRDRLDYKEIELMENAMRLNMTWQERAALEKAIFDIKAERGHWTERKQADMMQTAQSAVNRRLQLAEALETLPELAQCETEDEAWKQYQALAESVAVQMLKDKVPAEVKHAAQWAENHYIIGDALERIKNVHDRVVHFAEVDPPYAIQLPDRGKKKTLITEKRDETYTEIEPEDYIPFYENIATQVYRVLDDHAFAVFWYGITWHNEVRDLLRKIGFGVPDVPAIWVKGEGTAGQTASPDTSLGNAYETFFLVRKGQPKLMRPGRSNVFKYQPVAPSNKIHRTEKPIDLMLEILMTICQPGARIIIPFLGSGVTLRAAYMLQHTGYGYDLSQRHKDSFLKQVAEDMEAGLYATDEEATDESN
jgi:ParB/RepB/Spo0J family partition protein